MLLALPAGVHEQTCQDFPQLAAVLNQLAFSTYLENELSALVACCGLKPEPIAALGRLRHVDLLAQLRRDPAAACTCLAPAESSKAT
jgi:hypothetical protein